MNITRKTSLIIVLLAMFVLSGSMGNEVTAQAGRDGGRPQGPPPEAFTACEGKSVGDSAEFVNPHGDTVTGTCQQQGDRLVLIPDGPPPGGGRGPEQGSQNGPPSRD